MQWQPIQDLPDNWQDLANAELPPLVTVWNEQAERLRNSDAFQPFLEELRREIAIETGIIERLYTLDRGITRTLVEQGIKESLIPHGTTDLPTQQVVALIQDQETAIEGLFDFVGGRRTLSTFYIKQLHQLLTQNQGSTEALMPSTGKIVSVSLISGDWKKQSNNPMRKDGSIYEYCPPEQVASEMDRLVDWHRLHAEQNVPPEVEAAWLHHRFTQIHPFQDGNGRVARCLASLVFIKAEWFPLALDRDERSAYIAASEDADRGDLSSLVDLFSKSQKRVFVRSLGLSEQVLSDRKRTQTVIASITDKIQKNLSASIQERCQKAETYAEILLEISSQRLQSISEEIKVSLQNLVSNIQTFTVKSSPDGSKAHYHRHQIVETAKQLDYFANLRPYHQWIQLVINLDSSPTIILLSFHVLGRKHIGLLACSACAYHRDGGDEGENRTNDIQSLADSLFQFSYADEEDKLVRRFQQWLEDAIVNGLEYWNQSL